MGCLSFYRPITEFILFEACRVAHHVVHRERDGKRARIKKADLDLGASAFIDARYDQLLELHLRSGDSEGLTEIIGFYARPVRSSTINVAGTQDWYGLD